ncbi:hypothetical protein SAMN05443287_11322 [Micromonospora phaseoli]|uniref:Uncharacterized protein n=1 Tax=Micromonospora phaseoli TaxID=1144548 RepID=A0A1H7DEW2_9ACTN|nr:hypothetical protein [Micromonospora phaseoli]PZV90575.1 hypothetical protein CLV64_113115 [Micromonospora phaseoli]GIJ78033.1 hypothetical protein Xph01_24650 [Micromonospora phaseoli]SEJ99457.1 hypothetical protein SAMN05443287_11322 [Micromonospora phaseoli]
MSAVRRAVEFLVTRLLRSRLGVALGIAVLVLGVVGGARLVAGPPDPTAGLSNRPSEPITTVHPTTGDDGAISTTTTPSPVTRPGEPTPELVAERFVTAWLGRPGQTAEDWHETLRPLSTAALTEKFTGVDQADVPTGAVTDDPTLRPRGESFVEALIPLDTGQLRLELVAPDGRWLVDAVDWSRDE